ncbi:MAG TPA: peptidoglycan recognition family protein [Candidatus Eremiobacteraeota bacterium]|nr:MAG: N-acetylmuramoyl-L-alanine amidase [bacterium ADurb.Bin363]HPZ07798.1 peptidoglycan recognition family protein [Candidatus Eremiobacteraeota bacterium]
MMSVLNRNSKIFKSIFIIIALFSIFIVKEVLSKPLTDKEVERLRPKIIQKLLPYEKWTKEYTDYFQRHYHDSSLELKPKAIVMHYTGSSSMESAYNTFYNGDYYDDGDVGTIFGHLSVHYIIDSDGTIYQTLPCNWRCRGAYGVNQVAISIEIAARNEDELLSNQKTLSASFKLVKFLKEYFYIPLENIWGHYEVAEGKYSKNKTVREYYTDYGDSRSPDCYPPAFGRSDPGQKYMRKLRDYLKK